MPAEYPAVSCEASLAVNFAVDRRHASRVGGDGHGGAAVVDDGFATDCAINRAILLNGAATELSLALTKEIVVRISPGRGHSGERRGGRRTCNQRAARDAGKLVGRGRGQHQEHEQGRRHRPDARVRESMCNLTMQMKKQNNL